MTDTVDLAKVRELLETLDNHPHARERRYADATIRGKAIAITRAYVAQAAEIKALREALEWYGENARLCRLVHSGGDVGRHALADDGGKRAQVALTLTKEPANG